MTLEEKIKHFALNPEHADFALALLKVGTDKGHDPKRIMQNVIGWVLLEFHKLPITNIGQN
jgi:hypothetical protein